MYLLVVYFACNTHYLPSLVHPTLAMYSVPGNKEVKGTASSLSCVLTICKYNQTHTLGTPNYHFGEEKKTLKDSERLKDSLFLDGLS